MAASLITMTSLQTGWIGVDIGSSHVKLVQLTGGRRQPRLAASTIVPRSTAWEPAELAEDKVQSSAAELAAAVSLRPDFRGRKVAAMLPMSLCQSHQFDRSLSTGPNRERGIRQALEAATQRSAAGLQFAAWPAELDVDRKAPVKTNVLAMPQAWADKLVDDIVQVGWSCQLIDGLPWALARAVAMVPDTDRQTPWAALDWGYSQATLCIVLNGRPVYVRTLKDCSVRQLIAAITDELMVTADEAWSLLQEYGLGGTESTEVSRLVEELIAEPLAHLEQEIARTLGHLRGHRRTIVPQGVYLFGGGATLRGLAAHLTGKLELPHQRWRLGGNVPEGCTQCCLFGPAIALSALAWEQR